MKKHNPVRDAIDESLCGVRFNAQDMRSVLRAARRQPEKPRRAARRRGRRLDLVFAAAMLVLVVAPISLFALRAHHAQPVPVASIGEATPVPDVLPMDTPTPVQTTISPSSSPEGGEVSPVSAAITVEEAIAVARGCFEAHCDTSIFTFEEYAVQAALSEPVEGYAQYTVRMTSVYDNGCSFTVVVSAEDGSIIQYSTPSLATQPTFLNTDSQEVRSWFAQYGMHAAAWPQDVHVEFSRRYQGGILRMAGDGEITYQQAQEIAASAARDSLAGNPEGVYAYPALYAERASEDGLARYIVYCYAQPVTSENLPEAHVTVTLLASDGTVESVEAHNASETAE